MLVYFFRRLFMMIPTLFGITLLSFVIINLAPGSPVEQKLQAMRFGGGLGGGEGGGGVNTATTQYGVSQEVLDALNKQYGFDKPIHIRYMIWVKNIVTLDFGESFKYEEPVIDVIMSKFPVSLQFGIVSLILIYLVCIPLGISKAVKDGSHWDSGTSVILFILYSIPPLMLGILLMVLLAGGSFLQLFPLGGLYSDGYHDLSFWGKVLERAHHFVLPLICYMIGSFTVLTFVMKNSLLDEIKLDYVRTARSKGLSERKVIYKHALRNALIPIATGLSSFLGVFFAGSIIIESIFRLDGMGLLGFDAALSRDYNVLMGLIFIQAALTLIGRMVSDFLYILIDPRIDFS